MIQEPARQQSSEPTPEIKPEDTTKPTTEIPEEPQAPTTTPLPVENVVTGTPTEESESAESSEDNSA